MSISVKILFFAKAKELSGLKESQITLPETVSYKQLLQDVVNKYNLKPIEKNIIIALNQEFSEADKIFKLEESDIIAVIPPLSGG
ncbi:PREDICTED: molybdopterin synthase sulfur carrier subunit [Nicrophorus vespilloides]|uniref:Molybdopterin synthase sulfur carrier subunit n=1 Tax=Nicrophorus vespilloides TaxID=110193 RepID=A0ABM1MYI4_NICVS|nr:PREDICTED: molybdopterin synthase sulfur carrier subunit [Nicrophorus vespilloides]